MRRAKGWPDLMLVKWWHGSGKIQGDRIEPPHVTGVCRSGDDDYADVVFITPDRALAVTYSSSTNDPWIYEVVPDDEPTQDTGSLLPPGTSMMCGGATIRRRFKPSNAEVSARREIIARLS